MPTGRAPRGLRKLAPRHRDDLAQLHARTHANLTGTAVRPTYLRRRPEWEGRAWTDCSGQAAGYVFVSSRHGPIEVVDYAGDTNDVLRVLARLARRRGQSELRLPELHHRSELARHLRRGNCRVETSYARSGRAMVRTIHLASSLGRMRGELSRRLRDSHLADWRRQLLVADGRERVLLEVGRGHVIVSPARATPHTVRGGDAIAQLLIGTDEPRQTAEAHRMRLTGEAPKLLEVLFPSQQPSLGRWDMF